MKQIESPEGKLGILLPGMGAVGTTLITGVLAAREGLGYHPRTISSGSLKSWKIRSVI